MSNRRVMVHDVIGTIDLNGQSPQIFMTDDRMPATGQHDTQPSTEDDQSHEPSVTVGRDAFLQRLENEWRRDDFTAGDGKLDSTELDEEGVVRPDQATAGIATLAKPRGREAFMQRMANGWKQPSDSDEQSSATEEGAAGRHIK